MCHRPVECEERGHYRCHEWSFAHLSRHFPPMLSVQEEVEMLEKMKEALEKQLEIINERLGKLKT